MNKSTVYYAHPMSWYGTPEEAADVAFLETQYAKVINPSSPEIVKEVSQYINSQGQENVMQYFASIIRDQADEVAFRRFRNGQIGSGVGRELFEAHIWNKPVHRLSGGYPPFGLGLDTNYPSTLWMPLVLTVDQTRARIKKGTM